MTRRAVLLSGVAAITLGFPAVISAQPAKTYVIGWLSMSGKSDSEPFGEAFLAGMRSFGYAVGRNLSIEYRYAGGDYSRLPALAAELVRLKPDVLVAIETPAVELRRQTKTIPIVVIAAVNPVEAGLVRSLARPDTNVTGLAYRQDELAAKHVDLLAELNPKLSRIALFIDSSSTSAASYEKSARAAASAKGLSLLLIRAGDRAGLRDAFALMVAHRPEALVVAATGGTWQWRREIIEETRRLRIPAITSLPSRWADAGGLATYGPNYLESFRYAAHYVDRILKGGNPASMPVEQSVKFELVVNLKTAREIGVTVPPSLTVRADRVIQ